MLRDAHGIGIYTRLFCVVRHRVRGGAPARKTPTTIMARLVMKFGGTSVADIDRIRNVARHVKREADAGHQVAVVVSAMSGVTDQLVEWCEAALKNRQIFDAREYDAVVATGEQVTAGLLAITLQDLNVNARSWQGWQLPILTSNVHAFARILQIDGAELIRRFSERKEVAVIAGFQGLHKETGRITTLGRGGSDTSAVAVAAAIRADRCDIYTDVDGVYTSDPRVVPRARRLDKIAFEEMLELASLGAKVLQVRSVELGMVHNVRIFVRSSFEHPEDIDPYGTPHGTLICDEEEIMEQQTVTGIAFSRDEAQISVREVEDKPGIAAAIFIPLAEANINVDMIVQNVSADDKTTDLTFTVPAADYQRALDVIVKAKEAIGYKRLDGATDVAKISVIGIGMRSHAGVAAQAFRALAERAVNIRAITTSEIKFSLLIDAAFTELAVRTLHSLYGLDRISA
jgi:aspartate kinase